MEDEEFYRSVVDQALTNGTEERTVQMTIGELFLFHFLLQTFSLEYVGEDRFIPLMERNAARLKDTDETLRGD